MVQKSVLPLSMDMLVLLFQLNKNISLVKTKIIWLINWSRNAIYALNSYIKNTIGQLQPHIAVKMFDSQIVPIMQYTSEIWFQNKKNHCN